MYLEYQNGEALNATATVVIRYFDEGLAPEWDVYLGGLPNDR